MISGKHKNILSDLIMLTLGICILAVPLVFHEPPPASAQELLSQDISHLKETNFYERLFTFTAPSALWYNPFLQCDVVSVSLNCKESCFPHSQIDKPGSRDNRSKSRRCSHTAEA